MFFDTYALIEIAKGSKNYSTYIDQRVMTTKLNLMELYYTLLRTADEMTAEEYFNAFLPACSPINDEIMKAAMKFKLEERKKRNLLSYIDCIGYFTAMYNGERFITGDIHFKNMKNVEFVS